MLQDKCFENKTRIIGNHTSPKIRYNARLMQSSDSKTCETKIDNVSNIGIPTQNPFKSTKHLPHIHRKSIDNRKSNEIPRKIRQLHDGSSGKRVQGGRSMIDEGLIMPMMVVKRHPNILSRRLKLPPKYPHLPGLKL